MQHLQFRRDSPVVLYIGAIEILICGACAHTAARMYQRRRHAQTHPAEASDRERQLYIKVQLDKTIGFAQQLYGVGFRTSSDGLECLLIEAIRPGSFLHEWNRNCEQLSPEELVEEALGDLGDPCSDTSTQTAPPPSRSPMQQVQPGAAIVAVNDVTADVGMMQAQLMKSQVTIWVRPDVVHPSQLTHELLAPVPRSSEGPRRSPEETPVSSIGAADGNTAATIGHATDIEVQHPNVPTVLPATLGPIGPSCACLALEDEAPQILTRWVTCSLILGWVTLVPVLLMQPHEQRPRQQLFRQYLLKPSLLIMPVWAILWILDSYGLLFEVQVVHPFYFFIICHMIFPGILVWYLIHMQAADEKIMLDQRQTRLEEVRKTGCTLPFAIEDPPPLFFKELIMMNPVVIVLMGACVSIPLVVVSLMTPMETARAKMAQGYVNLVWGPCIFLQIGFFYILWHMKFVYLPQMYVAGFGMLLTIPCFVFWCCCLICASRYGRQDVALVEKQRVERAREATADASNQSAVQDGTNTAPITLVDCTEVQNREWELIYTA